MYLELFIVIAAAKLMHTAAEGEGRNGLLWILIMLIWLAGLRWLLGGMSGSITALAAMVAAYSTMFLANLSAPPSSR